MLLTILGISESAKVAVFIFVTHLATLTLLVGVAVRELSKQELVFFTKGDNVANLNKAMAYVVENEFTNRLKIVTFLEEGEKVSEDLLTNIHVLDRAYTQIEVEVVTLKGHFGPDMIEHLSQEWQIPKNFMFIGSPGDRFPYQISELGGVRLII